MSVRLLNNSQEEALVLTHCNSVNIGRIGLAVVPIQCLLSH